jgi:hypothetical protein
LCFRCIYLSPHKQVRPTEGEDIYNENIKSFFVEMGAMVRCDNGGDDGDMTTKAINVVLVATLQLMEGVATQESSGKHFSYPFTCFR